MIHEICSTAYHAFLWWLLLVRVPTVIMQGLVGADNWTKASRQVGAVGGVGRRDETED